VRVPGSMKRPSLMSKVVIHHYQIKSLEVRDFRAPYWFQTPC
jgi:hypothetical protein